MENRIDSRLQELRRTSKVALVPYVTLGFPDLPTSESLAEVILAAGGDMLEIGIPFSDPLADGPTIQRTSFQALKHGANLGMGIEMVRRLRSKGTEAPLIFMGYFNSFLHYGVERFAQDASDAGLDGIIVADLPTEEAGPFGGLCQGHGIYLIPLLAPTSPDDRIANACHHANGFVYCVSLSGVTGARKQLASGLPELVGRIRRHTDLPVIVGFGVSTREHVEEIGRFADGAVVASALLEAIDKSAPASVLQTAKDFVEGLITSG